MQGKYYEGGVTASHRDWLLHPVIIVATRRALSPVLGYEELREESDDVIRQARSTDRKRELPPLSLQVEMAVAVAACIPLPVPVVLLLLLVAEAAVPLAVPVPLCHWHD